jgi:hypothetical protein
MSVSTPFLTLAKSGGVAQDRFHTLDITGGTIGVSAGVATIAVSVDQAAAYTWTNTHTFSNQIAATGGVALSAALYRSNGTVAANGTTQGAGTALTKDINYVTSATGGVHTAIKLPAGAIGLYIDVVNTTAVALQVFPQSSAAIDALGANAAFSLPAGATARFYGYSSTQWYGAVLSGLTLDHASQPTIQFKIGGTNKGSVYDTGTVTALDSGPNTFVTMRVNGAAMFYADSGSCAFNGLAQFSDTTNSTAYSNGAAIFSGGIGVAKQMTSRAIANDIVTAKNANYTVLDTDTYIRFAASASRTVTLPSAASYPGRMLTICNSGAFTIISASSNVVPMTSTSAGTAILAGTSGKWATLVSNGTNWFIQAGN